MKKHFGFKELLSYTTPYRRTLLVITILMLCESGVALVSPWLAGRFTEAMLTPSTAGALSLKQILLCWLAILALQGILNTVIIWGASSIALLGGKNMTATHCIPLREAKRGTGIIPDSDVKNDEMSSTCCLGL